MPAILFIMKKQYNINSARIINGYLHITINGEKYKFDLSSVSDKLANASENELNDYEISPSGYGIHWRLLDEDLSIKGLLQYYKKPNELPASY